MSLRAQFPQSVERCCSHDKVLLYIVEMLLGSSNAVYTDLEKSTTEMFSFLCNSNASEFDVEIYLLTVFGQSLAVDSLSGALVQRLLRWFGKLGSQMQFCRKFAFELLNLDRSCQTKITSEALSSVQATMANLLTASTEALCDIQFGLIQKTTRVADFDNSIISVNHSPISVTDWTVGGNLGGNFGGRRPVAAAAAAVAGPVSLLGLYEVCKPWEALYQSAAGIACTVLALPGILDSIISAGKTSSTAQNNIIGSSPPPGEPPVHPGGTHHTAHSGLHDAALKTKFAEATEGLVSRGIMQELYGIVLVGNLLEPRIVRAHQAGSSGSAAMVKANDDQNCNVEEGESSWNNGGSRNMHVKLLTTSTSATAMWAKHVLTGMMETVLLNLTSLVWQPERAASATAMAMTRTIARTKAGTGTGKVTMAPPTSSDGAAQGSRTRDRSMQDDKSAKVSDLIGKYDTPVVGRHLMLW
jgi:hypothetical protein